MPLTSLSAGEARLEAQYQKLVAKYYFAQADFLNAERECTRLRTVVQVKQEVIALLLPHYPYSLTLELQSKIALT